MNISKPLRRRSHFVHLFLLLPTCSFFRRILSSYDAYYNSDDLRDKCKSTKKGDWNWSAFFHLICYSCAKEISLNKISLEILLGLLFPIFGSFLLSDILVRWYSTMRSVRCIRMESKFIFDYIFLPVRNFISDLQTTKPISNQKLNCLQME